MFDLIKKSLTFTEKPGDSTLFHYETGNKGHDGQGDFFGYLTDFLACMSGGASVNRLQPFVVLEF